MERYQHFLTNGFHFRPEEPEYWHTYLINNILLILIPVFLFLIILNVFVHKLYVIALIDLIAILIAVFLLFYFHKTNNVKKTSLFTVAFYASLLFVYILISGPDDYAFAWILVFPAISYLLLGGNIGRIVTVASIALLILGTTLLSPLWLPADFSFVSLINLLFTAVCITILISYSELSRSKAYDFIKLKMLS